MKPRDQNKQKPKATRKTKLIREKGMFKKTTPPKKTLSLIFSEG